MLSNNEGKNVITILEMNIFSRFGIISDGGSHFCNKSFRMFLEKYDV